jgi:hypothetical protein
MTVGRLETECEVVGWTQASSGKSPILGFVK